MKPGMSSWRPIETTPVAHFAGDEAITPQAYESIMTDGYAAIAAYVLAGAKGARIDVDSVTKERWRRLTVASHYIDNYIDTAKDTTQAHKIYKEILTETLITSQSGESTASHAALENADPRLGISITALKHSIAGIATPQLEALQAAALTINDAAREKSRIRSIEDYIDILEAESNATADLYDHVPTVTVRSQPGFKVFSQTFHDVMQVAVFGDSAVDLKDDYEQGITQVPPTVRNMGRLALQAFRAGRRAYKQPTTWYMLSQVKPRIVKD